MGLLEACSLARVAADAGDEAARFLWEVPDGWQQDRGAWGGLVVAAIVNAGRQCDPAREVRTVSVQIPAPVLTGPQDVTVTPVKQGSSLSVWSVCVRPAGDGQANAAVVATGTVLTGAPRVPELDTQAWGTAVAPAAPAWEQVPVVEVGPPMGPVFTRHVEFRVLEGIPFSGGEATALGYVRMREQQPWDAATLLGLVDAWWPASLARLPEPHPAATVSFEAHLLVDPAEVPPVPLRYSSRVLAARQGYTTESRSLWHPDGRLVVENLQSIAIIR